jgi:hypothetical protein
MDTRRKTSEVKKMNKKMKGIIVVSLILAVAASVVYAAPVLAYMNGTIDQTRDRDQDRLKDQTCDCDGSQTQTQTQDRTQLRQQDCIQNRTCDGSCQQYQYQYRFRYQTQSTP